MFTKIKLKDCSRGGIYPKENKKTIQCSLMKKLLILISILVLNIIFILIILSSKKIGNLIQKYLKRALNKNSDILITSTYNSNKVGDISSFFIIINGDNYPCEIETYKVFQNNQQNHWIYTLKCPINVKFPKIFIEECISNLNNCGCKIIENKKDNLRVSLNCLKNKKSFNCSGVGFFQDDCDPNIEDEEEIPEYIFHILDQIENGKFSEIFTMAIEENKTFTQYENNITYQISTVSSQYSTNLSTISLEECESILKERDPSTNKNEPLILFKLEHKIENFKIPIIEYQLFTREGKKLNLSYCDEKNQFISIPVKIDENKEFLHDPNNIFYKDKCYTYTSEYDTDMTLYDRKNDFNENFLSLCEKDCIYKGYNYENKTSNCECKTKTIFPKLTTETLNIKELLKQFVDFKKIFTNIYVIGCPKELFSSKGMNKNSGSYISIIIIIATCLFTIFFCIKGYNSFKSKINNIISAKFSNHKEEQNETATETQMNIKEFKLDNQIQKDSESDSSQKQPNFYNDYEINNLKYPEALEIDKRTCFQIYKSIIRTKHIFFFTFFNENDYNSTEIKICLFLFWLSLNYTITALFFNDSTLHKIYEDRGKYSLIYQLPIAIYSILISFVLTKLLTLFSIFEEKIAKQAKTKTVETEKKINEYIVSIKWKFVLFFSLIIFLFVLFWYYLSCFCAVFRNTQKALILNTIEDYVLSLLLYPFIIALIPCLLRYCALKSKKKGKNKECLYKASNILGEILFL